MSLRAVAAALADQGHFNERGKLFNPNGFRGAGAVM
jgi:hypothetical protein